MKELFKKFYGGLNNELVVIRVVYQNSLGYCISTLQACPKETETLASKKLKFHGKKLTESNNAEIETSKQIVKKPDK